MRIRLCVLACVLLSSLTLLSGQQRMVTGSASISGLVLDIQNGAPVRFARVMTTHSGQLFDINSDEAGRFRLDRLPAGSYVVSALAPRYLATPYGSAGPRTPGTPIVVADGQRVSDVIIRLVRGAVVSGRITTPDGQPVVDVEVRLLEWGRDGQTGERALVSRIGGQRATDAQGAYRLYDVPPGTYLVATTAAPPSRGGGFRGATRDTPIELATHADVLAALAGAVPPPPRITPRVRSVPTFYPGEVQAEAAQPIAVAAGDEISNVDFHIQKLAAATIRGRLATPDGTAPQGAMIHVSRLGNTGASTSLPDFASVREDTAFHVGNLTPGHYVITAQSQAGGTPMWAVAHVTMAGRDITGLTLALEPSAHVSGRVRLDSATLAPAILSTVSVRLTPVGAMGESRIVPPAGSLDPDGRFRIAGVIPGRYLIEISRNRIAAMADGPQLWLKSAVLNNRNAADVPVDIGADISDAVVTVSDRATELAGTVVTASGERSHGAWVILFSANRDDWQPRSRRIKASQVQDGAFTFTGVPPGSYLAAVVAEVEYGEWFDRDFLERLAPAAQPVTLSEGETARRDLRIGPAR